MKARLGIELHAVSVRRGRRWVLRDVSLQLCAGERWALIGGNGAGKTQLLKLLATDIWPTPTGRGLRTYRLGARRIELIDAKPRIAYVGAELQEKYARYAWNLPVHELLATGLHRTDLLHRPVAPAESRLVAAMLKDSGLAPLAARRFLSLSYGQKRLALLARALIRKPDWLLLDELYNGLDLDHRRRVERLLARARSAGQSWVAAAHRGMDVPCGTHGLIELHDGSVRLQRRLRGTDLEQLARAAAEDPPRPRGRTGPLRPVAGATAPAAAQAPVLVRVIDADLYVDYRAVLAGVNWTLRAGEQWAVFGGNGSGKTTLLKLLYGDLSPAVGGVIERRGCPPGTPIDVWKRQVGYVSPELQTDYAVNVSVFEMVVSGRYASIGLCEAPTATDRKNARKWLEFFALSPLAERRPAELSYGQMRRALIARALAGDARLLLLDEPLTGLDPEQRALMKRLLARLMQDGITLVLAVHHPEDLPNGMTHAMGLRRRRLRAVRLPATPRLPAAARRSP